MRRWPWLLAAICLLLIAGSILTGKRNQAPGVLRRLFDHPAYQLKDQTLGSFGAPRGGSLYHQVSWYTSDLSIADLEKQLDQDFHRLGIARHFGSPQRVEWQTKDRAYSVAIYAANSPIAFPYFEGGQTIIETIEPHAFGLYDRLANMFSKHPTALAKKP